MTLNQLFEPEKIVLGEIKDYVVSVAKNYVKNHIGTPESNFRFILSFDCVRYNCKLLLRFMIFCKEL